MWRNLDSAAGFGPAGCGFKSRHAHQQRVQNMKIKVEKAGLEDADNLIKLEAKCFGMRYDKNFVYFWKPLILDAYVYKAMNGKKIIGGMVAFVTKDPKTIYIDSIYTKPEYRHHGIATKFFERVEKDSKCKKIILDTMNQYKEAVTLYRKLGFKKIKILKDYYEDGTDRLLMIKN